MVRVTKAMREAREAAECQAALEAERQAYFPTLLLALERASKNSFDLTVEDGKFVVRGPRDDMWKFPVEYTGVATNMLWELDYELNLKEAEEREAQRKFMVRQQALAKLTKEEREELGL